MKKITDQTEYKSVMTALQAQQYEQGGITIASLSGVLALPKGSDHKKDYSDYLSSKY